MIDYYIIDLPIINSKNNHHKKIVTQPKEPFYLHGLGCKKCADCFQCTEKDCTWQSSQKPRTVRA